MGRIALALAGVALGLAPAAPPAPARFQPLPPDASLVPVSGAPAATCLDGRPELREWLSELDPALDAAESRGESARRMEEELRRDGTRRVQRIEPWARSGDA